MHKQINKQINKSEIYVTMSIAETVNKSDMTANFTVCQNT